MPDSFDDLSGIRHVQKGDAVAEKPTSQPTRALEMRLQRLEERMTALASSSVNGSFIIPNVASAEDVTLNSFVFFNASTGLYELGLAGVTFLVDQFVFNSTAQAIGLVVAKNGTQVDVMVGGYAEWENDEQKEVMLEEGEKFRPGSAYYLSATQAGRITSVPPALRIQVLVSSQDHFVINSIYSNPESIESIFRIPIGMRPVGGLRKIAPDYLNNIIVGFDALEFAESNDLSDWRLTSDGTVENYRNFGYMLADAEVTTQPAAPIYICFEIAATTGVIKAYSADTLLALTEEDDGSIYNEVTITPALTGGTKNTLRVYSVSDLINSKTFGTIRFRFTDTDVAIKRRIYFKFPNSFQGWKMIYSPISPLAIAKTKDGAVTEVVVQEGSIGYFTKPSVFLTGHIISIDVATEGSGYTVPPNVIIEGDCFETAVGQAVLEDDRVVSVILLDPGKGYTEEPTIVLQPVDEDPGIGSTAYAALSIGDGTGATAEAVLNDFGTVSSITVLTAGEDYASAPDVSFDSRLLTSTVKNGGSGGLLVVSKIDNLGTVPADPEAENFQGTITEVAIEESGNNYETAPSVVIVDEGGPGTGAEIVVHVRNGKIVSYEIADGGQNYVNPKLSIFPSGNNGYKVTKQGTFTVVLTGDAVTSITVVDGGYGYPKTTTAKVVNDGMNDSATLVPTINNEGRITSFAVSDGGEGYTNVNDHNVVVIDLKNPLLVFSGGDPDTDATGEATLSRMFLDRVEVTCEGSLYSENTTLTLTPLSGDNGLINADAITPVHAQIEPVIENGRIVSVKVISPGTGYYKVPVIRILTAGAAAHNAVLTCVINALILESTILTTGKNYKTPPDTLIGVPLDRIEILFGGAGYTVTPTIDIGMPDLPNGKQATGTAVMGGQISKVVILTAGTGYDPATTTVTRDDADPGTGEVLVPLFDEDGALEGIQIVNPGHGFTAVPVFVVADGANETATIKAYIEGQGSVVAINVTRQGTGYTSVPDVNIQAEDDDFTTQATAEAILLGEGVIIVNEISGDGGIRMHQDAPYASGIPGNNLQIYSFDDDTKDGNVLFPRPKNAVFYYNVKADPNFKVRYPSAPVERCTIIANGVELTISPYQEATRLMREAFCDVGVSRKTLFWTTFGEEASPWDANYRPYILELGQGGVDHLIPHTGLEEFEDSWWRLWEHLYKYEPFQNNAWIHLNKASRFYQSSRVSGLGALAPLRLIDVATGVDAKSDGTLMGGQLMLTLDNQVNLLGGTLDQIEMTRAGDTKVIYQNNTGRTVFVSSVILQVVFQQNQTGLVPAVSNNARILVGTQEGSYRDLVGTIDPDETVQQGIETKLYAEAQGKELFPDSRDASKLILPQQKIYLRVDVPAGAPIVKQVVVARIKGHVL